MGKRKNNTKENLEVIAKGEQNGDATSCDSLDGVVTSRNHLVAMNEASFSQSDIEKLIVTIRGMQVMMDYDLARVYGVDTKVLNQAVKRNARRFPDTFRFQLTSEEMKELVTNCDRFSILKHSSVSSHVFTEPGVAQLSSVLHSDKAIDTSVKIMNAFVAMRRYLIQNAGILMRISDIERHQMETDEKIDRILDTMEFRSSHLLPEQIFKTGCVWDAWAYVSDLVRSAKKRIVLIDNFVDDRVLSILSKRADGVTATIHSRYHEMFLTDLKKHNEQYPAIEFVQLPHRNHDRFLIIDEKVYLLGASLKDVGTGLCAITEMHANPEMILELLK